MKTFLIEQAKPFDAITPIDYAAGANVVAGNAIDRLGFAEALVSIGNGAGTGGGSYTAVWSSVKITSSDDNSGWTDPIDVYTLVSGEFPILVSSLKYAYVNLAIAKRYIRIEGTLTVGGTGSPVVPAAGQIILGGKSINPAG